MSVTRYRAQEFCPTAFLALDTKLLAAQRQRRLFQLSQLENIV